MKREREKERKTGFIQITDDIWNETIYTCSGAKKNVRRKLQIIQYLNIFYR